MRWILVPALAASVLAQTIPSRVRSLREQMAGVEPETASQHAALETSQYIVDALERAYGMRNPPISNPAAAKKGAKKPRPRKRLPKLNMPQDLVLAEQLVEALCSGEDPFETRTGDMRMAYRSEVDGTLQPYRIFVPEGFDRQQSYPLMIVLHGLSGDENTYFDRYVTKDGTKVLHHEAQQRGYIVAAPKGRAPSGRYIGAAEKDVLDVVEQVMAIYPIREDQIFLTGHSLGGVGTWKIGFRHAARFAGLAAVGSAFSGQRNVVNVLPLDNKRGMPVLYVQGRRDWLATLRMGRLFAQHATRLLPNFIYKEFPDNHSRIGTASLPAVFDFFDQVRDGREWVAEEIPPLPAPQRPPKRKRPATKTSAAG